MPKDDIYIPVQVGKEGTTLDLGYAVDNTGENISCKNNMYSELTALYWAWKNLDSDYIGLVHYRRHFSLKNFLFRKTHKPMECVLTQNELIPLLEPQTVIVPKKRKYFIETIKKQYEHTMFEGKEHLNVTRSILADKHPQYVSSFDKVMNKTSAYMFNMFIMPKTLADSYCTWLFDILFELEARIDSSEYSDFDKRYLGRVSERLLNVWLASNNVKTKEIGRIDLWKVNYVKKASLYLLSKFFYRKYRMSS